MTDLRDARPDHSLRERILESAAEELTAGGTAGFSADAVAARAQVDRDTLLRLWPGTAELLRAALVHWVSRAASIPDSGSLRGDLLHYAKAYAALVNTPVGHRLLDALIIRPRHWARDDAVGPVRGALTRAVSAALTRAIERRECRADIDPAFVIDFLMAGLSASRLFYDRPVTEEECEFVVATLLDGLRPRG